MAINIATGDASIEFDDIEISGRVSLRWNVSYSVANVDRVRSPIGRGWFGLAFCSLRRVESGFVFTTAQGAQEEFIDPEQIVAKGGVVRKPSACLEIFREPQRYIVRSWNVETGDIQQLCFDTVGDTGRELRLTAIEDVTGTGVDLLWQNSATETRLVGMRQRIEGREMRIGYDRVGWIDRVDLRTPEGAEHRLATYEHDATGHLIRIGDAAGASDHYEYDVRGRISREILKDGGVFYYRYDDHGRCILHSGVDNYNKRRLRYSQAIGVTEVTDSYGMTTTYKYLPTGQVLFQIDPAGGQRETQYDEHGRIAACIDSNGAATKYSYDPSGNRSLVTDPLGNVTQVRFNDRHQPVELIDPAGSHWRREYDAMGRLTLATDPLGGAWRYFYDRDGNLAELVNPLGAIKRMTYQRGALKTITDWMGHVTQFRFDGHGRVAERRGPLGELTQVRYDAVDNPIEVRLPDRTSITASYDQGSNLIRQVDPAGRTTRWRYGPCNRLLERIDAAGGILRYIWGTEPGRLEQLINEKAEVHTFEHDSVGRVVAETSFDGAYRQYRLDAEGRLIAFINANGEMLSISRDPLGRIIKQRLPDGEQLFFVYNAFGELIQAINGGIELGYERDALGRVTVETQGKRWVRSEYDAAGGLVRMQTSEHHNIKYELDANSRPIAHNVLGKTIHFHRDANGRETERTLPGGGRLVQNYDIMGRLAAQQLTPSYGVSYRSPTDALQRSYTYALSGELAHATDAIWGEANYTYDPVDRLLSAFRSSGLSERFEYDPTGNIVHLHAEGMRSRDETLTYGPGNRLLQQGNNRFEFDAEGRCIRRIDDVTGPAPKIWTYHWNVLDRLQSVTCPDGKVWRYRYDALARRIEKICDNATVCNYLWDRDVVVQELLPDASSRSWLWETDSFAPVGTVQQGRLFSTVNDPVGTPREFVDERGTIAGAILLDSWGRLTETKPSSSVSLVCDIRFQGQWADPESGLHYNFFRYYDPASGRYISSDPLGLDGDINAFGYVPNPFAWVDPLGLCNGNSKRARRAQHGYEIVDTANGNVVVKTGVSGKPLNQNGSSPRANAQANRWNSEPGNAKRYEARVVRQEPAGPKSRQNILGWEQQNANANRATLDPARHKRP